jgi:hypothetical protein
MMGAQRSRFSAQRFSTQRLNAYDEKTSQGERLDIAERDHHGSSTARVNSIEEYAARSMQRQTAINYPKVGLSSMKIPTCGALRCAKGLAGQ